MLSRPARTADGAACRWANEQIRPEHASVDGVRRQLGTGSATVWESIEPLPAAPDADPARFEGVTCRASTNGCGTTWRPGRSSTAGVVPRSRRGRSTRSEMPTDTPGLGC